MLPRWLMATIEWWLSAKSKTTKVSLISDLGMAIRVPLQEANWEVLMKLTSIPFKFALSTLLAGALMLATPNVTFAQHRGGGGGGGCGGNHSSSSRGSSGGRSFSGQRGGGGGGGRSFSGQRGFSGGQRGFAGGERGFRGGGERFRGGDGDRFRGGYGFGYYGAPFYGYGGYYAPNSCGGYYDQWGNWQPDPRCGYDPYYGY